MKREFDYLVIGAGSSGSVIASRLSENRGSQVALIEAGPRNRGWRVRVPVVLHALMGDKERNWDYVTTPQAGLNGRRIPQPRGRGLGGSSTINAMVYIRGHRYDYDQWAAQGNAGWSWDEVLPWFRKSEDQQRGADAAHGVGGPLPVSDLRSRELSTDTFLAAAAECAHTPVGDFNSGDHSGVGRYQVTQRGGERWSVARAYLEPHATRDNLDVETDLTCERLVFEGGRCVGLQASRNGETIELRARREVVLSAGAFGSPQLLMLSGIGSGEHLREHGINTVCDLPGVGRNLQEHLDIGTSFHARAGFGMAMSLSFVPRAVAGLFQYLVFRSGPLSSNVVEAGGFLHSRDGLPAPDIQLHFLAGSASDDGKALMHGHSFTLGACVLRPQSRGSLRLTGNSFAHHPDIDFAFLSEEQDKVTLLRGARMAYVILNAPAFTPYRRKPRTPGQLMKSDEDFLAHIRASAATAYHPVGTCKMGPDRDPLAVVDAQLRVRGVEGLRVADASIMPTIISGNTNAACIMIGEKTADMILRAYRG